MSLVNESGTTAMIPDTPKKSKFKLIRNIFIACWSILINGPYSFGDSTSSQYEAYGMLFGGITITFFIVFLLSELLVLGHKESSSRLFKIKALIGMVIGMFLTYNILLDENGRPIYNQVIEYPVGSEEDIKGLAKSISRIDMNDNGEIIVKESGKMEDPKFEEYVNYTIKQQEIITSKIREFEEIMILDSCENTQQLELSVATHDEAIAYLESYIKNMRSDIAGKFTEIYGIDELSNNEDFIKSMSQNESMLRRRIEHYRISKEYHTYLRDNLECNEDGEYLPAAKRAEYETIYAKFSSSEDALIDFLQKGIQERKERIDTLKSELAE